jgi:hypothetical protein
MQAELQAHLAFHLTGRMPQGEAGALAQSDLHPAILAEYRDLTALRYDFPLVLIGGDAKSVQSLSGLFDGALKEIATGADGDRVRKYAFRLERAIRKLIAEGMTGSLFELWDTAAARLGAKKDKPLQESYSRLRGALKTNGAVVDCDQAMPFRLFQHAFQALQDQKAQKFRTGINKLIMKLSDILSADFVRSKEGLSADRLRASVGAAHHDTFDFDAMSRVLAEASPKVPMPESRRQRVRGLLTTLRTQRFFAPASESDKWVGVGESYSFVFEKCSDAVAAYRERLPKMVELAKAITMAKLETNGEYSEARHDGFFAEFGANGLDADAIAEFPDYLICLRTAEFPAAESDLILQAFLAGMRAKLVVQTDDLLEASPVSGEYLFSGLRGRQLVSTALGFGTYYILQSSSSGLFQLREPILRGLAYPGPAVFSVFSGASGNGVPPYLVAAAAAESRAFPAFTYDPSAGSNWASRFSLQANSQLDRDWPLQRLDYEDAEQQLVSETLAFTFVDFMTCDPRCAKHFAQVPRAKWGDDLLPVAELLAHEPKDQSEKVPCLVMVDGDNRLQKVIVDEKLMREARACLEAWRSLQELGGVHNSHAERLVEQERKVWAEQARPAAAPEQTPAVAAVAAPAAAPAVVSAPAAAEAAPERSPDEAYIETFRCSSCNECTQINDKMFGYDANKQAFIKDLKAGTYRQMVDAAENCQLSIIHPGKPWNPNEPGLDESIKRAEAFM